MHWTQWAIPFALGAGWQLYRLWRNSQRAPVVGIEADDPEMIDAIGQARASLPQFLEALGHAQPGHRDFAVKAFFPGLEEHMWIEDPVPEPGGFSGRLGNAPRGPSELRLGQPVTVAEEHVTDWKYVQHDVLVGGYSIRLIRRRMDERTRRDLDSRLDFGVLD